MSNLTQFFSIHDVMDFAVIDHTGYINRRFNTFDSHYANFKTNGKLKECDMIFEVGKFEPDLENTYVVGDGKFYFGEDSLYVRKESYKGAKWRFQVHGINNTTTVVKIDCNALGRISVNAAVFDFLIHLKLLEKGFPLIHASAVSKNGGAFAFSSRGGGGKTTVALELASNGFNFIGDNFVMVHNSEVFAFPTALSIFTYNLAPIVASNLNSKEKTSLAFKKILYKGTMGYAKIFTKINPKRVFSNMDLSSKLHTGLLLIPNTNNSNGQILVEELDFHEFINKILYNQMLEFPYFCQYIEEYSYLFPQARFSQHWKKYKESLKENFSKNSSYYKIIVPKRYNKAVFEKIVELVEGDH
jgi:hypothetical protein